MTRDRSRSRNREADEQPLPRSVLVTGAAGLLGQAVARELHAANVEVVGCDRTTRPSGFTGSTWVQCDLADGFALRRACTMCDAVIHLGGISGPGFVFDPPVPSGVVASTNITGTLNVLEAALACGARRLVFASSVIVYWPADRKPISAPTLTEASAVDSSETYGASKIAGEQLCRAYAVEKLLDTVSCRIGWVYGPGRTTGCPIKAMIQGSSSDTPESHHRDFVFVDDAARALARAVLREKNFFGITLNVSGAHIPHSAVVAAVEGAIGKKVERLASAADSTPVDPVLPAMDLSAAKRELSWEPKVSITEGVRHYFDHLQKTQTVDTTPPPKSAFEKFVGLWQWDTPKCEKALEYYQFWGTLTDAEAQECATSFKEFRHVGCGQGHLELRFKAADTTRNADFGYTIHIDKRPHEIDPLLRARANNSIKMNPSKCWTHWWQGENLIMEQPCIVREQLLVHRVTRVVSGDSLRCEELITVRDTGEELLRACHAYKRITEKL